MRKTTVRWRRSRVCTPSKPKDYITAIDEKNHHRKKEIKEAETYEDLERVAKTLVDMRR